jgi:hypothetical protein
LARRSKKEEMAEVVDTSWFFYLLEALLLAYVLKVCYNFRSEGMHMTRAGDEDEPEPRPEEEDSLLDEGSDRESEEESAGEGEPEKLRS